MKFVFAPDSMKGSLTALRAVELLRAAALKVFPDAQCVCVPVADGGEGTVDALCLACGGERRTVRVTGPLGRPVDAVYALADGNATAILEMAQASGLPLTAPDGLDPLRASSYGTGEMIRAALDAGARRLLIGIGGSATNDGGMGMLCALGARFRDERGEILRGCGADMARVAEADFSGLCPALGEADILVICDVTNPLLGERGATAIYGPQKGVTPAMMPELERGMAHYAHCLERTLGRDVSTFLGAGAAGGMGAALGGVLKARMRSGIDAVLELTRFDELLDGCDLVVTGEGRIDRQSVEFGKVPAGVARRCREKRVPVVALVGGVGPGAEAFDTLGQTAILPLPDGPMDLSRAMEDAERLYSAAAGRLFAILSMGVGIGKAPILRGQGCIFDENDV